MVSFDICIPKDRLFSAKSKVLFSSEVIVQIKQKIGTRVESPLDVYSDSAGFQQDLLDDDDCNVYLPKK